ncbi:hypothetical protein BS78_02G219500 [Paspalum vaginatum]|nr:hypothetical protein BS78_02G219500 [Paspalum vaginatum]
MARILAAGAASSSALGGSSWFLGLCMFVVSVWVVSFAVFVCGHSSHGDGSPRKKPPAKARTTPTAAASRGTVKSSRTVADSTSVYTAAYVGGAAAACGCSAGHGHGGGGGGCGGGGGGGGGGCGGGGGGGGC